MPRPNGYLLDTNILVALVRDNDLGKYLDRTYQLTAAGYPFYISVVVLGETSALALKFGWGAAKQTTLATLLGLFDPLDIFSQDVIEAYALIDAASDADGYKMGKNDLWIAATARVFDLTLLTTDHDFDHLHAGLLHAGKLVDVEWVDPTSK